MESDWRWLVFDTGWGLSNIGLVARLRTPIGVFTHVSRAGTNEAGLYALGLADEQGYVEEWFAWSVELNRSFPAGYDVFSD